MENNFIFPACENIEKKSDRKTWFWTDCLDVAKKSGCSLGTIEFWLVYKIRVYETHGDYKFCIAGVDKLAKDIGVTPKQIEIALMDACKTGKLYHIWCDKKVYRNKTKIYVTKDWLNERGLNPQFLTLKARGGKNTHYITGTALESGEVVNVKSIKTKGETLETKVQTLETKGETLEFPHMNKYNRISIKECNTNIVLDKSKKDVVKNRKVDENGVVVGGNVNTERAYELWEEIMGQPCKRNRWNGNAGYNMMRAKNKGEEWLRKMLILARECKKDPKADFRAKNVANLFELQKNQDFVLDWARQKVIKKNNVVEL